MLSSHGHVINIHFSAKANHNFTVNSTFSTVGISAITTRHTAACVSVAPRNNTQHNKAYNPKMVATKSDINGSLEEGLHILEGYLSRCNNGCMWKENR